MCIMETLGCGDNENNGSRETHQDAEIDQLVANFLDRQTTSESGRLGGIIFKELSVIGAGVGVCFRHIVTRDSITLT